MENIEKCPFCKKDIDKKASVCPHCTKDLSFKRNPGCMFTALGLGAVSFGLLLIWIPFIGIPMIVIGLLIAFGGVFSGIVKTVCFFKKGK